MVLYQQREGNRREVMAAEFLAQYHNAWVDARAQAAGAIRRYNELVHATNSAGEVVWRAPSSETAGTQPRAVKPEPGRLQSATLAAPRSDIRAGENGAASSAGVRQNREPEVDLMAQISTLQQQLHASHEREKNLQKELSKAQRRAPPLLPRDANLPS
jgi:hypothetical protein